MNPDIREFRAGFTRRGGPEGEALPAAGPGVPAHALDEIALGIRLLALAVVAGAGALLPLDGPSRTVLVAGIVPGAAIGWVQQRLIRARRRDPAAWLTLAHVVLWTLLLGVSGGQRSPLFAGYLLEVALAGMAYSRRAAWLTAAACLAAFAARAVWLEPPLDPGALAHVSGFLAVGTLLTSIVVDAFGRQRARLREYHAALQSRATSLTEELHLLGDSLAAAHVVLDDLGRVVSANAACARLLGRGPEMVGRCWQELLALDPEGAARVARILDDGEAQRGARFSHRHPDGRQLGLRAELWSRPQGEGRRTYLLLAESAPEAEDSDPIRRLGEAVGCVAHQFRNSVQALQGLAGDLLAREPRDSPERARIVAMLGVVASLGELSGDVLAMANPSDTRLEAIGVEELLRCSSTLARGGPLAPRIEVPERDLRVHARRGPLVHALFNLIDNACRVSPAGEAPLVRAGRREDGVGIWIEDRGPGLPESSPRGARPDARAERCGYGLVAARRFIEGCGGSLSFSPRPGGGTSCLVLLPACPAASDGAA